jgi:hypothetical protein
MRYGFGRSRRPRPTRLNSGPSLECAVSSFEPNLNCREGHSHLSMENIYQPLGDFKEGSGKSK